MPEIRALSITRPWSTLIMWYGKDIENRTWGTGYRGPLLIHAAKSWDEEALDFALGLGVGSQLFPMSREPRDYPTGVLGVVDLVDVCDRTVLAANSSCQCSDWAAHRQFHWRITRPRPLTHAIPYAGRLGLWQPTGSLLQLLGKQGFRWGPANA